MRQIGDIVKKLITLLTVTIAIGLPIAWYEGWLKPLAPTPPPPKVQLTDAERDCKVAELYEGAWETYDMTFMIGVIERALGQPCDNFRHYTLLRAPSQEASSSLRYPGFVLSKPVTERQKAHLGWARYIVALTEKGGLDAVMADEKVADVIRRAESQMAPEARAIAQEVRACATRTIRVWRMELPGVGNVKVKTDGVDEVAMRREMHPTLRFRTPSGAWFFCPKSAT